jgi:hypothetical protein
MNNKAVSLTSVSRVICGLCLALLWAVSASAYTVVMRDGRRFEIPDKFTVTDTALTYEHAPGLNVTLFLANLDIEATEQANREPAGALRRRAQAKPAPTPTAGPRTFTNADLATYRAAREKYEQTENRRRAAAGLPSLEEERARVAENRLRESEAAAKAAQESQKQEAYWRERAARIRAETASIQAQINRLESRLNRAEPSSGYFSQPAVVLAPGFGFGGFGFPNPPIQQVRPGLPYNWGPGFNNLNPATQVSPQVDLDYNRQVFQQAVQPFPRRRRGFGVGFNSAIVLSANNAQVSNDAAQTLNRLDELHAKLAAVNAQWELLQDEARRAGVPPGWLR